MLFLLKDLTKKRDARRVRLPGGSLTIEIQFAKKYITGFNICQIKERGNMTDEAYEQAAAFWTKKDATTKKMDDAALKAAIDTFLSEHKVCALATGGGDTIRCTPLEYTWHDGALWIFTEGGLKFRGLKQNKNVSAAVFELNTSFGALKSMQIAGVAEMVAPFSNDYGAEAAFRHIPIETFKKLPKPMWLIKITPREITYLNSDFKKDGYGSRQTWCDGEA